MDISLIVQIFILALFLSLNNFLVSVGMGFSKIWAHKFLNIALIFGLLDIVMPLLGLGIGKLTGDIVGHAASFLGVLVLALIGLFLVYQGVKKKSRTTSIGIHLESTFAIFFIGFWNSLDNLFVGFGLGLLEVSLFLAVVVFGVVTFSMTILGISIGRKIRNEIEGKLRDFEGKGRVVTGLVFLALALWKLFEIVQTL